ERKVVVEPGLVRPNLRCHEVAGVLVGGCDHEPAVGRRFDDVRDGRLFRRGAGLESRLEYLGPAWPYVMAGDLVPFGSTGDPRPGEAFEGYAAGLRDTGNLEDSRRIIDDRIAESVRQRNSLDLLARIDEERSRLVAGELFRLSGNEPRSAVHMR